MKLIRIAFLLCTVFVLGCGPSGGGAVGDANDPAVSGTDETQTNEKEGAVELAVPDQE